MSNREAAKRVAVKWLDEIDRSKVSSREFVKMFDKMTDEEVERFVDAVENEQAFIPAIYTNMTGSQITTENNFRVGDMLGIEFFQQLAETDPTTGRVYVTPHRYPVFHLPVRRQVQMLKEKSSIPEHNNSISDMTHQPIGPSKGSALSFPEIQIFKTLGLNHCIEEAIKARGGDLKVYNYMEKMIANDGQVDLGAVIDAGTQTKAGATLAVLLKTTHIDTTL